MTEGKKENRVLPGKERLKTQKEINAGSTPKYFGAGVAPGQAGQIASASDWQITTDKVELPQNSTWYVMTNLPGEIYKSVGNIYGLRTWIEYGFKQVKDELGWADYRVTDYQEIEKWWEIVCSAYLMISFQSDIFKSLSPESASSKPCPLEAKFKQHQWWDKGVGWKNVLNNLHLVIQPYIFFNLITPWLKIFNIPFLQQGFLHLINIMNEFEAYVPDG